MCNNLLVKEDLKMSKWARVNLEETGIILEVITYNPVGVINEAFLPMFKPCPNEVER